MASRKLMDAPAAATGEKLFLEPDQPLVQLDDGRCVFTPARASAASGIEELLIYDPKAATTNCAAQVDGRGGRAAGRLCRRSACSYADRPGRGDRSRYGTQPARAVSAVVEAGRTVAWTEPVVYGDKQVLISDGDAKLYRLSAVDAPRPHLEAAATLDLATPLLTTAAVAGDYAYAVDTGHHLLSYRLPDLKPGDDWPLNARAVWGPRRVGEHVLVASMSGQLTCVDGAGKLVLAGVACAGQYRRQPLGIARRTRGLPTRARFIAWRRIAGRF